MTCAYMLYQKHIGQSLFNTHSFETNLPDSCTILTFQKSHNKKISNIELNKCLFFTAVADRQKSKKRYGLPSKDEYFMWATCIHTQRKDLNQLSF